MKSEQIREIFLSYFKSCGYEKMPSASLIPAGDKTLLFVNAGMVPFKDYYLGKKSDYQRVCSSQKSVRAGGKHNDIEEVGFTARHHTFFEMLGNFVFSGASKEKAILEAWTLITEHYKLDKDRLWVTVYYEDKESRDIWENVVGIDPNRVIDCQEEDNFWSMGDVGPCGPCTEIFYDYGDSVAGGPPGSEDQDGDRFVEIWNLVFMQYEMLADGSRKTLDSMGLDTGMGLERITSVLQNKTNNFDTDIFMPIIEKIQSMIKGIDIQSARVIADHIRCAVFLIADQVHPSNEGRGYVLRRIIRRAIGFGYRAGMQKPFFYSLVKTVADNMKAYPELQEKRVLIEDALKDEEEKFLLTIRQGMQKIQDNIQNKQDIDGKMAFEMYDTYGFPIDILKDIAKGHGLQLDEKGFSDHMEKQRARSRSSQKFATKLEIDTGLKTDFLGYSADQAASKVVGLLQQDSLVETATGDIGVIVEKTPFYPEGGGQVGDSGIIKTNQGSIEVKDTQKMGEAILHIVHTEDTISVGDTVELIVDESRVFIAKNHSATHLLHAALRKVLGDHVIQKGSLVDADRLRFDFSHKSPMTKEEIESVERLVNQEIQKNHLGKRESMALSDAKNANIMALFDEKYEDPVNVISFGDFSKELCGGLHVSATGEIGLFKIISETGIASGVRRVEAVSSQKAFELVIKKQRELESISALLKCDIEMSVERVKQLISEQKTLKKQCEALEKKVYESKLKTWIEDAKDDILFQSLEGASMKTLRLLVDSIKSAMPKGLIILQGISDQVSIVIAAQHIDKDAKEVLKKMVEKLGGRGGGKSNLAQGVLDQPLDDKRLFEFCDDRS